MTILFELHYQKLIFVTTITDASFDDSQITMAHGNWLFELI